jgi:hypothetical protein
MCIVVHGHVGDRNGQTSIGHRPVVVSQGRCVLVWLVEFVKDRLVLFLANFLRFSDKLVLSLIDAS